MNRIIFSLVLAALSAVSPLSASAANDTGNPTGSVDRTSSCQLVTGWSYDADFDPVLISGCMNPTATNYDRNATVDNGSCTFAQEPCVSRYRWVNVTAGTVSHAQGCAAVGAVPMLQNMPGRGLCASGENRPLSGYDVGKIFYSRGVWGGGNGGGGSVMPFQNGGYRCYLPGQKQDRDNTDVTVAYYCDFGESFPASCPADNPPPRTYTGSGGEYEGRYRTRTLLNFNEGGLLKSLADLFKPFRAIAASSDSNFVEIYDGPKEGTGTLIATVPANIYRADVNATMNITGNHGFSWSVPAAYATGAPQAFYFYGTDTDTAGKTSVLNNSPLTLTCFGAANAAPSSPTLSCPSGAAPGASVSVSFSAPDPDGDAVRYLIDWDSDASVDQYVPANGYAPSGASQSASRSWSSEGTKVVSLSAQDAQGNVSSSASCSIAIASAEGPTEGGAEGNGPGPSGGTPQESGFTVSGTSKLRVQFLGGLSGKTEDANLSVNAINYTNPVTLSVESIRSAQGASLPADVTATYRFGGAPAQSMAMSYDGASGMYRDAGGRIGTTFSIEFSKRITQRYFVTIVGSSGANRAEFVVEIEPDSVNPDFREI